MGHNKTCGVICFLKLLLNNSVLVSVLVSLKSRDIEKIEIDKTLIVTGKIPDLIISLRIIHGC